MRKVDAVFAATGLAALVAGRKITGLALLARGLHGMNREWRARHPSVAAGWSPRWRAAMVHYEEGHRHPTNRRLHRVGVPLVVGGAAALALSSPLRPLWGFGVAAVALGVGLTSVGHRFEGNNPAFDEEPFSLLAAAAWHLGVRASD